MQLNVSKRLSHRCVANYSSMSARRILNIVFQVTQRLWVKHVTIKDRTFWAAAANFVFLNLLLLNK